MIFSAVVPEAQSSERTELQAAVLCRGGEGAQRGASTPAACRKAQGGQEQGGRWSSYILRHRGEKHHSDFIQDPWSPQRRRYQNGGQGKVSSSDRVEYTAWVWSAV